MKKIASDKNYDLHKKALDVDSKKELANALKYSARLMKGYHESWFKALPTEVAQDIIAIHGCLTRLREKNP